MAYDKAVDSAQLNAGLTTIADAIRAKGGTSDPMDFPQGMADAVAAISGGEGWDKDSGTIVPDSNSKDFAIPTSKKRSHLYIHRKNTEIPGTYIKGVWTAVTAVDNIGFWILSISPFAEVDQKKSFPLADFAQNYTTNHHGIIFSENQIKIAPKVSGNGLQAGTEYLWEAW